VYGEFAHEKGTTKTEENIVDVLEKCIHMKAEKLFF